MQSPIFGLVDSKRVGREELQKSDSDEGEPISDGETSDLRAQLAAHLSSLISLDFQPLEEHESGSQHVQDCGHVATEDGPQQPPEFEFRLFASSAGPVPKVVLETAEDHLLAKAEGSIVSQRPVSCYLRGDLTPGEEAAIRFCAVSGAEVCRRAKERAWGLEIPWRVVNISHRPRDTAVKPASVAPPPTSMQEGVLAKRKRPGKKMRILLRTRERTRKEKEAIEAKQKMTKEEHLKEKRKRLNREKKLKRRKKDKEKKTTERGSTTAGGGSLSADSDGDN